MSIPLAVFLNLVTIPQVRGCELCLQLFVESYSKYLRKSSHIYIYKYLLIGLGGVQSGSNGWMISNWPSVQREVNLKLSKNFLICDNQWCAVILERVTNELVGIYRNFTSTILFKISLMLCRWSVAKWRRALWLQCHAKKSSLTGKGLQKLS